jgi:hypothetical protein
VDDCNLNHCKKKVMDSMIKYLHQEYDIPVSRGKIHKYIGMTLDFTVCGQVNISMFDYVDEIIAAFDKAEPKVVAQRQAPYLSVYSKSTRAMRNSLDEISQRHPHAAADSKFKWKWHPEMVGGRIICGTP